MSESSYHEGTLLLYRLAIRVQILIHIISDYDRIWVAFPFGTYTNIFKNSDSKVKMHIIL